MLSKQESLQKAKTVFNTASDYFDHPALSFWNVFGQQTIDRLSLQPGARVLDVCCGSGASAIPAAQQVGSSGQVIGVDIAESLLELARHKCEQQGLENIQFLCADFENLGIPSESFDAIVCVFGIFFVPDMIAGVQELWRMLKPGGKLAITSWGKQVFEPANQVFWQILESERPDLVKNFTHWDRISDSGSLHLLLETAGMRQVQVFNETGIHFLSDPEDWWIMILGGGCRGTIEQLDPEVKERIRVKNLDFLRSNAVSSLDVDVLYAVSQK